MRNPSPADFGSIKLVSIELYWR